MRVEGAAHQGDGLVAAFDNINGTPDSTSVVLYGNSAIAALAYRQGARLHAPKTLEEIESAVRQLARQGFGDHTIGHVVEIDVLAVRRILAAVQGSEDG